MRRIHVAAYDVNLYVRGDIQIKQAEHTKDKAVYTAQDALSAFENNTGHTDRRTDGRTYTTSYRDATAHLKRRNT